MHARKKIAMALVCLSMAGCFKAKKPKAAFDNDASTKLVESYNETLKDRLKARLLDVAQIKTDISRLREGFRGYTRLEGNYLKAWQTKCQDKGDTDLKMLRKELIDLGLKVRGDSSEISTRINRLIAALRGEKEDMENAEKDVGRPVVARENIEMVKTLLELSAELKNDTLFLNFAPLPPSGCPTAPQVASDELFSERTGKYPDAEAPTAERKEVPKKNGKTREEIYDTLENGEPKPKEYKPLRP